MELLIRACFRRKKCPFQAYFRPRFFQNLHPVYKQVPLFTWNFGSISACLKPLLIKASSVFVSSCCFRLLIIAFFIFHRFTVDNLSSGSHQPSKTVTLQQFHHFSCKHRHLLNHTKNPAISSTSCNLFSKSRA